MNSATERAISAVLETDGSVTREQRSAALEILNGRRPPEWPSPPLREPDGCRPDRASAGNRPTEAKVYLRRHEAAKYLGCSVRQIDSLKHDGDLPFHRLGRRLIVFKTEDIEALMRKSRISIKAGVLA
jgi:excisionase family DNA binding protein